MRTLLPLLLLLLAGCQGAVLGNLVVLGVTFGIFMGTLRLGRAEATRSRADASTSEASAVPSTRR
ncbi:MAG: hypothetical protein AAF447_04470 [Myxococcota bacterium]